MLRERHPRVFLLPGTLWQFTYRMEKIGGQIELVVESRLAAAVGSTLLHRISAMTTVVEDAGSLT